MGFLLSSIDLYSLFWSASTAPRWPHSKSTRNASNDRFNLSIIICVEKSMETVNWIESTTKWNNNSLRVGLANHGETQNWTGWLEIRFTFAKKCYFNELRILSKKIPSIVNEACTWEVVLNRIARGYFGFFKAIDREKKTLKFETASRFILLHSSLHVCVCLYVYRIVLAFVWYALRHNRTPLKWIGIPATCVYQKHFILKNTSKASQSVQWTNLRKRETKQ